MMFRRFFVQKTPNVFKNFTQQRLIVSQNLTLSNKLKVSVAPAPPGQRPVTFSRCIQKHETIKDKIKSQLLSIQPYIHPNGIQAIAFLAFPFVNLITQGDVQMQTLDPIIDLTSTDGCLSSPQLSATSESTPLSHSTPLSETTGSMTKTPEQKPIILSETSDTTTTIQMKTNELPKDKEIIDLLKKQNAMIQTAIFLAVGSIVGMTTAELPAIVPAILMAIFFLMWFVLIK